MSDQSASVDAHPGSIRGWSDDGLNLSDSAKDSEISWVGAKFIYMDASIINWLQYNMRTLVVSALSVAQQIPMTSQPALNAHSTLTDEPRIYYEPQLYEGTDVSTPGIASTLHAQQASRRKRRSLSFHQRRGDLSSPAPGLYLPSFK